MQLPVCWVFFLIFLGEVEKLFVYSTLLFATLKVANLRSI